MQALTVIIPGEFYDSQIYDGRLYLWKIDGSLLTVNWDVLVGKIGGVPEDLNTALEFALQHGDDLYGNPLMQDTDVSNLVRAKFERLAEFELVVRKQDLANYIISHQDSPLPFPHADSLIHYKTIYTGGQSGVSTSKLNVVKGSRYSVETAATKLFDMPVLSLSASNLTLAIAGGYEGLFDYSIIPDSTSKVSHDPRQLSKEHCNFVRWLYPSIFGSSYSNQGYFADFKRSRRDKSETTQLKEAIQLVLPDTLEKVSSIEKGERQQAAIQYKREFQQLISSDEIFPRNGLFSTVEQEDNQSNIHSDVTFAWGVQDKICLASKNSIRLARYTAKMNHQKFKDLGSVDVNLGNEIVSADSSFFGVVIEKENGLLVITSSLENYFLEGEPVNWRVFPKSRNYTNQLHVIYDNALHIHCFTHDYFVDQTTKKLGITVATKKKQVNSNVT